MSVAPSFSGYQRLGRKTFLLLISEQIVPSIIIFVAAVLLLIVNGRGVFAKTALSAWGIYIVLGAWLLFILVLGITLLIVYLTYANYQFMLDDDALKIRQGILSRQETAIPYRQIQDVDLEQSISDRVWGVARLAILTAGNEGSKGDNEDSSEGLLPAIDRTLAESLQTELLKRADVQKVINEK